MGWRRVVYKPGKGLAFHFDKDEYVMKERQQMLQPVMSSVLYLTGDSNTERLGPTAIIDQQYDAVQQRAVPDSPSRTALVFPSRNNYVLFDGRLGHGVLGSLSQKPRMTMLINWWADKPQDVSSIPQDIIKKFSLSTVSSAQNGSQAYQRKIPSSNEQQGHLLFRLQHTDLSATDSINAQTKHQSQQSSLLADLGAMQPNAHDAVGTDNSSITAQQMKPNDLTTSSQTHVDTVQNADAHTQDATPSGLLQEIADCIPHAAAAAMSGSQAETADLHQPHHKAMPAESHATEQHDDAKPQRLPVPTISIAGWDESPVSVDDVLQTYGINLTGPKAMHAVAIDHSGFELFPLDEENLEANAGSIVTAAAFVPAGLIAESQSGSDDDNG